MLAWLCLGQGADLYMVQLMPLPLTISCSSKSRLVLPSSFYLSGAGSPGWSETKSKRAVKRLCVWRGEGNPSGEGVNYQNKGSMRAPLFCGWQQRVAERRPGGFERSTVRLLETWYKANIRHPYPDDVTLAALATGGGISVKQVRKWLANRRVRSFNTLTYNGSVHPRRLRRLRRQRDHRAEPPQFLHSTPVYQVRLPISFIRHDLIQTTTTYGIVCQSL